ncbi:unnamed protein product [Laminaria digitata]
MLRRCPGTTPCIVTGTPMCIDACYEYDGTVHLQFYRNACACVPKVPPSQQLLAFWLGNLTKPSRAPAAWCGGKAVRTKAAVGGPLLTAATVGGLPPFSLPCLGHSGEWRRTELNIELENMLLAQRDKQSRVGTYSKQKEPKKNFRRQ